MCGKARNLRRAVEQGIANRQLLTLNDRGIQKIDFGNSPNWEYGHEASVILDHLSGAISVRYGLCVAAF
jgi:hypothetical protein